MNEFRVRATGAIITEPQFRALYNKAFPAVLTQSILADHGCDAVLPAPQPDPWVGYIVVRNGAIQDTLGNWVQAWTMQAVSADILAAELAEKTKNLVTRIDTDTDALYRAVVGERQSEYDRAEQMAAEFAAGGYQEPVPESISAWAAPQGWTAQQAADNIIATAVAWRAAQDQVRTNRLGLKEAARQATSITQLNGVANQWNTFLAAVKVLLGVE